MERKRGTKSKKEIDIDDIGKADNIDVMGEEKTSISQVKEPSENCLSLSLPEFVVVGASLPLEHHSTTSNVVPTAKRAASAVDAFTAASITAIASKATALRASFNASFFCGQRLVLRFSERPKTNQSSNSLFEEKKRRKEPLKAKMINI